MFTKKETPTKVEQKNIKTPTTTALKEKPTYQAPEKKQGKTKVTIKYDVGFSNELYIRGKGANLSWEKGQKLRNTKNDEWTWESDIPFTTCEFKVLINDTHYEAGENHHLAFGTSILYTPQFK